MTTTDPGCAPEPPVGPRPHDLAPLREAARQVDRSVSTLREWIRDGELIAWKPEGNTAPNAPTLVSLSALRALMVLSGKPIHPGRPTAGTEGENAEETSVERPPVERPPAERSAAEAIAEAQADALARLEGLLRAQAREHAARLELTEARAALRVAEVEREAIRAEAAQLRAHAEESRQQQDQSIRALEAAQRDLRDALERERVRADGLEAEVQALRAAGTLPWWRRLLA